MKTSIKGLVALFSLLHSTILHDVMGFDVLCIWIVPAYECSSSEPGELSRAWGAMHYNIIPTSPSGSFQWHRKGFISLPLIQLISMESSENRVESIITEGNEGGIHQRPASQRHIYHLHRETPLGLAVRKQCVYISSALPARKYAASRDEPK